MKCKNCGHELTTTKEYPKRGEKGIAWFYSHKGKVMFGILQSHSFDCNCTNPEPKQMR